MRKVLIFLLLFGSGLTVLLLLRRPPPDRGPRIETPEEERGELPEFTQVPTGTDKPGERGAVEIALGGALDVTLTEEEGELGRRPKLYRLVADDVQRAGGAERSDVYLLENPRIDIYERRTGEVRSRLSASRGRMQARYEKGAFVCDEIVLFTVEMVVLQGAPIVPVTLRVPQLRGTLPAGVFESSDRVLITGRGFEAVGTGLVIDSREEGFRLVRDGRTELELERGVSAVLEATGTGAIEVRNAAGPEASEVEIRAADGARLALTGAEPLTGAGDEVVIRGARVVDATGASAIVPSAARIDGHAVLEGRGNTFRGRVADLELDPRGKLREIRLSGDPEGEVQVARYLERQRPDLTASYAAVSGAGPLVVRFEERTSIDLAGPGQVAMPELGFSLTATEWIRGKIGEAAGAGDVAAKGDVHVVYQERELVADELDVRYALEDGEEVVRVVSDGPVRVSARDRLGRQVSFEARNGGEFRSRGGSLTAPEARAVRLEVLGEGGFVAESDVVRDLDLESRSFTAEGNVVYEIEEGRGSADKAISRGLQELELLGTEAAPAVFELWTPSAAASDPRAERTVRGRTQAQRLVLTEGKVTGHGSVETVVYAEGEVHHLSGEQLELDYQPGSGLDRRRFHLVARDAVEARLESEAGIARLGCDQLEVDGFFRAHGEESVPLERSSLMARGAVAIDYRGRGGLTGEGDRLTVDERGTGRLEALPGRRVHAIGHIPAGGVPYEMTADWVEFDREHVEAGRPEVDAVAPDGASGDGSASDPEGDGGQSGATAQVEPFVLGYSADHLRADGKEILLEGKAHVDGQTKEGEPWSIDAGRIEVTGRWGDLETHALTAEAVDSLEARNGFEARMGERMWATGRYLSAQKTLFRMEGEPARLEVLAVKWESDWIELDLDNLLVGTGQGTLAPRDVADAGWSLSYESLQPFDDVDATLLVLRNPVFRDVDGEDAREVRAGWALFWIDRERWRERKEKVLGRTEEQGLHVETPPEEPVAGAIEGEEKIAEFAGILKEIYLEGDIEFLDNDRRRGRASAFYLDRLDGHGWIQDADVTVDVHAGSRTEPLRIRAQWMRVTADLQTRGLKPFDRVESLRADHAVITSCEFEEPHYVVETGDLRLKRNPEANKLGFDYSARKNKVRFGRGLVIPLPPIEGEDDNPTIAGIGLGNTARFGAMIETTTNLPLPRMIKTGLANILDKPIEDVRGGTRLSLGYLSSRGFLFGIGQQVRVGDRLWLDAYFDGIPDSGRDTGLVRAKTDRDTEFRNWFHGRGRFLIDPEEWIDLAFTHQTDAGVQSEFFEREFLRYEERDNYLHWRKARNQYYYDASVEIRTEDFRTDVEELPLAHAFRGATPIGEIGDQPILYTAEAETGYLTRETGTLPQSPFAPIFTDGVDEADLLRFETAHRLEAPFSLGWAGLRASPFVTGQMILGDRGVEDIDPPSDIAGLAGVDLGTTARRRYGNGLLHVIAPTVGVTTDVVSEKNGDTPLQLEHVEVPNDGTFVDLGLRTILSMPDALDPARERRLDVALGALHAQGSDEVEDGWQPFSVLGEALFFVDDVPVGITHDGRYDFENDHTVYSRSFLGFEPNPRLGIELGYHQGRDASFDTLYRAASLAMRYKVTAKWELEFGQTVSVRDDESLDTGLLIRRMGHDFVTEVELGTRAGEGTSFTVNFKPLLAWRRARLGLIDKWFGVER